ncbi:unnamed protein product [Microthlaspi erraticum]|uniref:Uncharacterized protein n=1 Tax=Microthlaspi erraticum TaxID=1685480 RepID=A0A6D2KM05_9BRAS|nr:unnamed protein product [Microthlaspi erraticum]
MLRGEGSKPAFTKKGDNKRSKEDTQTLTKEDEEEIERVREERRTKRRNDPLSSESEVGEFEIGVNIPHEENDDSPSEEEVKRSIKRLRRVSMRAMRMCPWKRRSQRKKRMSSPCTKSIMMLSSPWTLWRPSTHMMTQ